MRPLGDRAVDPDRLLEPLQADRPGRARKLDRLLDRQRLVRIAGQHGVGTERFAHRAQIAQIAFHAEAGLQLERAMAFGMAIRGVLLGVVRIDAGRVDGQALARRAAEQAIERQVCLACGEVPQRDVDAGYCRGDRPALAGLQSQHFELRRERMKRLVGRLERAADQALADVGREPRTVLSRHRRPVAPHLAPAFGAVTVPDAHEHHRAVAKGSERDLDRLRRNTKSERFD